MFPNGAGVLILITVKAVIYEVDVGTTKPVIVNCPTDTGVAMVMGKETLVFVS